MRSSVYYVFYFSPTCFCAIAILRELTPAFLKCTNFTINLRPHFSTQLPSSGSLLQCC